MPPHLTRSGLAAVRAQERGPRGPNELGNAVAFGFPVGSVQKSATAVARARRAATRLGDAKAGDDGSGAR